ncbi:PLD nuclease N-terminal domain-containing protein [Ancylomarina sp.]|uniref:PLD nuclease N-terminal domain-containing protein n=1 Tax=Ancylomarina sp. TaxID=1970196 RepID=UPI003564B82A
MIYLGFIGPFQILIGLFALAIFTILPIIALIDILRNEFTGSNKLIWVLVTIFLPFLGPLLYFSIGRNQKIRQV